MTDAEAPHNEPPRTVLLDPKRVRVWVGNARVYEGLTAETCRELIESMIAAGGQKVPAIVRSVWGDSDHEHEVVAGTRRHWAVSWLRANGYPGMCFLAQEAQLDDEAAFQLADLENRARKDVSDLERARNYADALDRYYGGHLRGMAQRLGVSPGWLSKTIKIATIPDEIVAAFANPADLQTKPAYALAQAIAEPGRAAHIRSRAEALASEQEVRRARGDGPLRPAEVMRRLIHGSAQQAEPQCQPSCTALGGGTIISIQKQDDDGLLLRLHLGSGVTLEEVVAAFREAILKVKWISGQDLTPGVFPRGNTGGGAAAAEQPTKNSTSSVRRHRSRVGQSEKQIPLF